MKFYNDCDVQLREVSTVTITVTDFITTCVKCLMFPRLHTYKKCKYMNVDHRPNVIMKNKLYLHLFHRSTLSLLPTSYYSFRRSCMSFHRHVNSYLNFIQPHGTGSTYSYISHQSFQVHVMRYSSLFTFTRILK